MNTPYFLIKEELLENNILSFRKAMNELWYNSIIAYSVKTNSLSYVLECMNDNECFAEVVSDEEYQLSEEIGFANDKIVFNGPIKSEDFLDKAFSFGSIINIDSKKEIDYIQKKRPRIDGNLGVRINIEPAIFAPEDIGYSEEGFRFGFSDESGEFKDVIELLESIYGHRKIGLHAHVNSVTRSLNVYECTSKYVSRIIEKYDLTPPYIDIGGGFFGGVPGKPSPYQYINVIKKYLEKSVDTETTTLIIEPGSAAIGSAIELHTSVCDIKDTSKGRIVTTDGSRIHIDPLWKKSSYDYSTSAEGQKVPMQIICGYTCMDHDRIMRLENEKELKIGDEIVYRKVGNYTVSLSGSFIKGPPAVYSEKDGVRKLVADNIELARITR